MIKRKKRRFQASVATVLILVALILAGASSYMIDYSLGYPQQERNSAEHWQDRIKDECPWTIHWMDSVYQNHCVKDTFVTMPSGYRAHAIYLYAPKRTNRTAVVVHGYKVRAEGMLHIAYLYNHDMGFNVLLPDLYAHGESEGDHIQMGWNDRWDVLRWSEVADGIFADGQSTRQVIHGISMGAATVMALSGEQTPDRVECFVEDCGYSSVKDEFAAQLKDQFGLPAFPLMTTSSWLCEARYGWSFDEARQIDQVRKSVKPMLFIHGDCDDFVPYRMLKPLYEAKTHGRKAIYVATGSDHAHAYRDHHEEYTQRVRAFVLRNLLSKKVRK